MKPEELLKVLENLEEDNFRKFKWHLEVGKIPKGHKGIPKSKLENAEMQVVVDLMVQKYATGELVEVTKKILEKIPRMDLVERLCESSSEEKDSFQPPTNQQTDGKAPAPSVCSGHTGSSSSQASQPPTPSTPSPTAPLKAPGLDCRRTATQLLSDDPLLEMDTFRSLGSGLTNFSRPSVGDTDFEKIKTTLLSDDPLLEMDAFRLKHSGEEKIPSGVMKYSRELTVDKKPRSSNLKMSSHSSTVMSSHRSSSSSRPYERSWWPWTRKKL